MSGRARKELRIDIRVSRENKELLDRAAQIAETSITGFMLRHSLAAARDVVATHLHLKNLRDRLESEGDKALFYFIERDEDGDRWVFKARRNLDVFTVLSHGKQAGKALGEIAAFYNLTPEAIEEASIVYEKMIESQSSAQQRKKKSKSAAPE